MRQSLLIFIIIAIVIGAGSFYGGMKYDQMKIPTKGGILGNPQNRQFGSGQGQVQGQGRRNLTQGQGANFVNGEILKQEKDLLTLKMPDGGSKIVFIGNANITKTASGTPNDLTAGKQIMVIGKSNADGSVTAQSIQLGNGFGRQ